MELQEPLSPSFAKTKRDPSPRVQTETRKQEKLDEVPRQDIMDKFEALKLMFESKLMQFKKESADEILDLREEQRFKFQSLMDCIN